LEECREAGILSARIANTKTRAASKPVDKRTLDCNTRFMEDNSSPNPSSDKIISPSIQTEIDAYNFHYLYSRDEILVDDGYIFDLVTKTKKKLPITGSGFVVRGK
jgi:hypothetical protein